MAILMSLCFTTCVGQTTDVTSRTTTEEDGTLTTAAGNWTSWPEMEQATTTVTPEGTTQPTNSKNTIIVEALPAHLTNYMYEVKEGDLQDIEAEESNNLNNIYIHFESKKFQPSKNVEVTSYLADSDTAVTMDVDEAVRDVRNRSGGADMISAFFVAPEDEVSENYIRIDKKKAEDRGDTRGVSYRQESKRNKGSNTTPLPYVQNSLTNDILAPLQAAVSLSHEDQNQPTIEKQVMKEMPVYKTYIEIQKSIPIELKEEPAKEDAGHTVQSLPPQQLQAQLQPQPQLQAEPPLHPQPQPQPQYPGATTDILHQMMLAYQVPQYRAPIYYRYPMYYIPQSYIGNYIMRHSHENTGVIPYLYRPRPMYYYVGYRPQDGLYHNYGTPEDQPLDQNSLQSEQQAQVRTGSAPIRPSQPVFSSVYPPETYRVAATMQGRGIHARSVRSKQLCIEYGGFKPPMVPSVQVNEAGIPQAQEKSSVVEDKGGS